ncbi:hypothetical protein QE152_g3890 [Popillia japonica]|uniref:Uncharacterized protein n=1 Tax=Popillia japonica TaxID=7064 RepID=A0AAW1N2V6_POPJA
MLFICIISFLLGVTNLNAQLVSSGKYKVDLTRILQCRDYPNAKLPSPLYARYVRYNRTQKVLNANYTLARDLDEVFKANIFLQKWGDGGWKNSFAFELKDVCRQFITFLKGFWIDFLTHFEVDDPENCPVRKGKYHMRNYIMPMHLIEHNFLLGTFNMKFVISRESVVHSCAVFYFDTVEKLENVTVVSFLVVVTSGYAAYSAELPIRLPSPRRKLACISQNSRFTFRYKTLQSLKAGITSSLTSALLMIKSRRRINKK